MMNSGHDIIQSNRGGRLALQHGRAEGGTLRKRKGGTARQFVCVVTTVNLDLQIWKPMVKSQGVKSHVTR